MSNRLRWSFTIVSLVCIASLLLACAPATPQVVEVPKEVVVEKPVVQTVVVEKEVPVEKEVVKTVVVETEKKVVETVVVTKEVEKVVTPTPVAGPKEGGTLNLWIEAAPADLFPVTNTAREGSYVMGLFLSTLVEVNEKLELVPKLAESVTPSPDAKEWTIKLRDAKWHDLKPVTAEDVAFTFKLILTPELASSFAAPFRDIVGAAEFMEGKATDISGIKVLDDKTVKITLNGPDAGFMSNLEFIWPVPKHVFGDMKVTEIPKSPQAQLTPIGNGPFQVVRVVPDQYIEFVRFDDYFLGKPHIAKAFIRFAQKDVGLAMLEKGEIDYMIDVPALEVERLKSVPGITIHTTPNLSWPWWNWPNIIGTDYLKDKRVRQAFMYASDRQGYVDSVLHGFGQVLHTYFPMAPWAQAPDGATYPYDPKKAKQLLDEAGWNYDTVVDLTYYSGNKEREQWLPIFQQNLRDIGVKSEIRLLDPAVVDKVIKEGSFALMMTGSGNSPEPGAQYLYWACDAMPPKAYQNFAFCKPELEDLFKKGKVTVDPAERAKIYQQIDRILRDEVGWLLLAQKNYIDATGPRLKGYIHNPNGNPNSATRVYHVHEWWIEE